MCVHARERLFACVRMFVLVLLFVHARVTCPVENLEVKVMIAIFMYPYYQISRHVLWAQFSTHIYCYDLKYEMTMVMTTKQSHNPLEMNQPEIDHCCMFVFRGLWLKKQKTFLFI